MALKYIGIPEEENKYEKKGFFSRLSGDLQARGKNVRDILARQKEDVQKRSGRVNIGTSLSSGIGLVGEAFGTGSDLAGELLTSAGRLFLPEDAEAEINDIVNKIGGSKVAQNISGAIDDLSEKYPRAATAIKGAGNIASVLLPPELGIGALSKAGKVSSKLAKATSAGSKAVGSAAKAGTEIASDVASSVMTHVASMTPQTVRAIFEGKVSKEAMASLDRVSLANRAKEGIDSALNDLSGLGKEYDAIRSSGEIVKVPVGGRIEKGTSKVLKEFSEPLVTSLKKYGLAIDENGRITKDINSRPFDEGSIGAIQEFVDTYGKSGDLTADQFLNVRQAADKLVDWNSRNPDLANSFAKTLRENYDKLGKAELTGLEKLDDAYSPVREELGLLKRDFITPTGDLKDTALTTLANLTNKGREQTLARLEKYVPGISNEIKILKALEDIEVSKGLKVGSYSRGALVGMSALANPLAGLAVFVGSHPTIVVPMLRALGAAKRGLKGKVESLIEKLSSGKTLKPVDMDLIKAAMLFIVPTGAVSGAKSAVEGEDENN